MSTPVQVTITEARPFFRDYLNSLVGENVGILTAGTTNFIGWSSGTLLYIESDYLVLYTHDSGGPAYEVAVPFDAIVRVRS